MKRNLKKILVAGASLLMLASSGAGLGNVNVNARHVRTYRTNRHHSRKALRRYNHERNVHKYNKFQLHHLGSIHTLEEQLGLIRFNQANHYVKNFYPYLKKEIKQDPEDYGHYAGTYFKNAEHDVGNGGLDTADYSEDSKGLYYSRPKFVRNYIKGLTNYFRYDNVSNLHHGKIISNNALDCGVLDANYYASRLVTERYARQHHMSKKWLRTNLNHPVYGYAFSKAGVGQNNFMSGAEFTPVEAPTQKEYRASRNDMKQIATRQFMTGLSYSRAVKPKYYSLKHPSYQELSYLKNSYYVNHSPEDFSNPATDAD